jgi:hypothetical protein
MMTLAVGLEAKPPNLVALWPDKEIPTHPAHRCFPSDTLHTANACFVLQSTNEFCKCAHRENTSSALLFQDVKDDCEPA